MMTVVDDRQQIRIFVSATAKELVGKLAAEMDMTEQGLASRVYQWFAQQDMQVRRAVLGQAVGEDEVAKARKLFKALEGPVARGVNPPNDVKGNDPPRTGAVSQGNKIARVPRRNVTYDRG